MQAFSTIHRFEEAVGPAPAIVASGEFPSRGYTGARCCLGTHAAKGQDRDPHPTCETLQGTVLPPWQALISTQKLLTNRKSLQTVSGKSFQMDEEHIS